ncbi:MAG: hypothetical protein K0U93_13770 [Gammaproteobacteria bacterium]|nr:hypothetical protein [Gammaproteobacteria bacterium]
MGEWLFAVAPSKWFEGTVSLAWPWWWYGVGLIVIMVGLATVLGYRSVPAKSRLGHWAIRSAILAIMLFVLFKPTLTVDGIEVVKGVVAVVVDDSLSMRIRDAEGRNPARRGDIANGLIAAQSGSLRDSLDARFETRYFGFGNELHRLAKPLTFSGSGTRLHAALSTLSADAELANTARPLAAVIVISDGNFSEKTELSGALLRYQHAQIPIHTIGVGRLNFPLDVEVLQVDMPGSVLRDTTVSPEIVIAHEGLVGQEVVLTVEADGAIINQSTVKLAGDSGRISTRVPILLEQAGPHALTFRVATQDGETLVENNSLTRTVFVRSEPLRVLHFEGEPRFEVKFLRRALKQDDGIAITSLVRTAENKFYRLGIRTETELAGGFPTEEAALFAFDVLVLGNVDIAFFSAEQQAIIKAFVGRRGGGLIALGGSQSFAAGGYARSTIADLLPIAVSTRRSSRPANVAVRPTLAGKDDIIRHFGLGAAGDPFWSRLPALTTVNALYDAKPAARTLLVGDDGSEQPRIVLALQPYGNGMVAAFPVRNTWRWQMHSDIPVDDQTHELLWRNLIRTVAPTVPGRLNLTTTGAVQGQTTTIGVELLAPDFASPVAIPPRLKITSPLGDQQEVTPLADPARPGTYRWPLHLPDAGVYEISSELTSGDADADTVRAEVTINASADDNEFRQAHLNAANLKALASSTGGVYVEASETGQLLDVLTDATHTRTLTEKVSLATAPIWLILLLVLACAEWMLRRERALP